LMVGNTNHRFDSLFSSARYRFDGAFEALGRLPYSQVLEKYFIVRGLIFPSICEEPLSYAIVESMLAGTIPIASRVGGNGELIGGSAAERYLFEPFRIDSLTDNVKAVLSLSEGELRRIGEDLKLSISNTLRAEETTEKFARFFEE
jgi:glycosyltransferase involved in cell wall biosynthesis